MTIQLPGQKQSAKLKDLIRIEGEGNYCYLYYKRKPPMLFSYWLLRYQEMLPTFLRLSKKHLVNPDHIKRVVFIKTACEVLMSDGTRIRIARRRRAAIIPILQRLQEND